AQDATLREHRKRDQQQQRRHQIDQLVGERQAHAGLPSSRKGVSVPSTASRNAIPRNSGTRKMRILAETISSTARPAAASASLASRAAIDSGIIPQLPARAMPQGTNSAMPMQV